MREHLRDGLWDIFWDEAREKLDEMRNALAMLVQGSSHEIAAAVLSRGGHTLKGNAGAMGLHPVADLAGRVEQAATTIGNEEQVPDDGCVEALRGAVDVLDAIAKARDCQTTDECVSATAELDAWLAACTGRVK
jgi:two-component system chemotaxis sensor kinase CheA